MSIAPIQLAMEQNRQKFDRRVAELRGDAGLSPLQRRRMLAETWVAAIRTHYQLLGEYLQLRDQGAVYANPPPLRLTAVHLRAPQRPDELPESLSRYATVEYHSEHLI